MTVRATRYLSLLLIGIVGWLPAYTAGFVDVVGRHNFPVAPVQAVVIAAPITPMQKESKGRKKVKCAECGSIVAIRKIEWNDEDFDHAVNGEMMAGRETGTHVKMSVRHEITIRMADGSTHVIINESQAGWRIGERLILIAGENSPNMRRMRAWAK